MHGLAEREKKGNEKEKRKKENSKSAAAKRNELLVSGNLKVLLFFQLPFARRGAPYHNRRTGHKRASAREFGGTRKDLFL